MVMNAIFVYFFHPHDFVSSAIVFFSGTKQQLCFNFHLLLLIQKGNIKVLENENASALLCQIVEFGPELDIQTSYVNKSE